MRFNDKKIFSNKELLEKMLVMRRAGWDYISLGIIFNVDHSTIYYECKKASVNKQGGVSFCIPFIIKQAIGTKPFSYNDFVNKYPNRNIA